MSRSRPEIVRERPAQPPGPRPDWLKVRLATGPTFGNVRRLVGDLELHTVCQEARCPNIHECWSLGTATFLIAGEVCTRNCTFCSVSPGTPAPLDAQEPEHVARAVAHMRLRHAVITSVTRDDLPDGGAAHWATTIRAIRARSPDTTIEVLLPDFQGDVSALGTVLAARPEVLSHNMETVEALYPQVRPRADYRQSLVLLRHIAEARTPEYPVVCKTGLMLGLGETQEQVQHTLEELAGAGVEALTLGQYLAPTPHHHPIVRWVTPAEFEVHERAARQLGIRQVVAGPLVRSSYMAHRALGRPLHDDE